MSDLNKLYLDIHNKMKSEHGFSSKALWGSENSQRIRFEILTKCMSPTQSTIKILDVGSGLGHLYGYLLEKGFEIDYTGLEINKEFVEQSKKTYPHAKFILGDINQLEELDEGSCKWPVGHPEEKSFYFCGRSSLKDFSYCKLHLLYAYQPKGKKEETTDKDEEATQYINKKINTA